MAEHRRTQRKPVHNIVPVVNAITGEVIGRIGNLSINGMMLVANQPLPERASFQCTFHLPGANDKVYKIELGLREQWGETSRVLGQYWTGFRIIDIAPQHYNALYDWLNSWARS